MTWWMTRSVTFSRLPPSRWIKISWSSYFKSLLCSVPFSKLFRLARTSMEPWEQRLHAWWHASNTFCSCSPRHHQLHAVKTCVCRSPISAKCQMMSWAFREIHKKCDVLWHLHLNIYDRLWRRIEVTYAKRTRARLKNRIWCQFSVTCQLRRTNSASHKYTQSFQNHTPNTARDRRTERNKKKQD